MDGAGAAETASGSPHRGHTGRQCDDGADTEPLAGHSSHARAEAPSPRRRSEAMSQAIANSLRHHASGVIMFAMNSSHQITARTITVTPAGTASAGEVVVQLSASPDPRWQACFHFVVQGRDGFFLQGRPVFDNTSLHGLLQAGQAEAFRQELPDLLVSASVLARAQVKKDAAR